MAKNIEILSIIVTLIISSILGLISVEFFGEYGWTIFVLIPLIIRFLRPFIVGKSNEISRNKSYKLSFSTLGIACLCLLSFAIEGIICIVMASPILALLRLLGSNLGYASQGNRIINSTNRTLFLILGTIGLMSFDNFNEPKGLIPVITKITVNSEIERVWKNVVTFNKIDEPIDRIFRTGIAYPTDATIKGEGVGAIRFCNFSTGSFVEPITKCEESHFLQFDVKEQPIPINELNPCWEVHPPHLDGYFKSYRGQFKLTKLEDNKTELEGTTWYQVDITPEIYWEIWSNFIVHRIYERVLNHIKKESEK